MLDYVFYVYPLYSNQETKKIYRLLVNCANYLKSKPQNCNGLSTIEWYFSHRQNKIILDWLMYGSHPLNDLDTQVIEALPISTHGF